MLRNVAHHHLFGISHRRSRTCWQVRKSATDTNTPAMTWAARVCRKIGVPSLGRSAAKSLTSVVVDILSSGFTYVACVPVTPTPFMRQPAGRHTTRVSEKLFLGRRETYDVFSASSPSRRTTRGDHRGRVITREREDARGAGGRARGGRGGDEEERGQRGRRERKRVRLEQTRNGHSRVNRYHVRA